MKKIPRQVVILGLISLFTDMASEMLYPVTPIFLASVLGASMASVGLIEGLAEITAGFLKGYFGFLSDKLGKRSMFVVGGYTVSALSKPLPGFFPEIFIVLISRVSDRIGKGIRTAPRDALLAGYSNKNNSGAIFGFHRGMDTLGAVIGPLAAILLLKVYNYNYNLIFILAFIPSIIAVAFTFFIKDKTIEVKQTRKFQYLLFWKESSKTYKSLVILTTVFSFVNSSDVFLILKSREISGSDVTAILGYVFYNLIYAAISYPAGLISDKVGKKRIYIIGIIIFSIVYFGFAISNSLALTWVLFALYGIYAASTEGVLKAWVSNLTSYEKVGSAVGLITMMSSIAMFLGSILAGALWDVFGSSVPFYLTSSVSLIVAIFLFRMNKD
jgi:MFS family permease